MSKPHVIIVRESLRESIITDTYSLLVALAMVLPGYFLNIEPLQWLGSVLFMVWLLSAGSGKYTKRRTIAEARAYLDELESTMSNGNQT